MPKFVIDPVYFRKLLKRVMIPSEMRCECKGQCGMNHTESFNVGGRCGLLHNKVYQFPFQHPITKKWRKGPQKVELNPVHSNHDRGDFTEENIMVFCQACKTLHDSREAWS